MVGRFKGYTLYMLRPNYVLHNLVMIPVTFMEIPERNYRAIWVEGSAIYGSSLCWPYGDWVS